MQSNSSLQYQTLTSPEVASAKVRVRATTVTVWLIMLMPLTGLVKGITGNRYSPLVIDLLLLTILALCLGVNIKRKRFDLLDLLLLTFLLIAFLQMFNPNVPGIQAGVEGLRKFAFMSIGFYLGRRLLDAKAVSLFQSLLVIVPAFIAIYGVKQFFHMSAFEYRILELATAGLTTYMMGGHLRPFSILPGPFHLGLYLTVSILWLITLLVYSKSISIKAQVLIGCILIIEIAAVFLTRTKSSWFGLAAGILIILILQRKGMFARLVKVAIILAVILVIVVLFMPYLSQSAFQVLTDAISAVSNISEAPTLSYREDLWANVIVPAILENMLWGFGTSSAGEGLSHLYESTTSLYFSSHNLYFKIVLEMGISGLFVFTTIVGISLYRGIRQLWRQQFTDQKQMMTTIWALAVIIAFLVAGTAVPVLDAYPPNYSFWVLLGILAKGKWQWTRRSR